MLLFPSLNFVGTFCRCLKAIVRWGSLVGELRFIVFIRGICEFWLTVKNGYRKLVGPLNCAPEKRVFSANFVLKKLALLENFTSKKLACPLNFEPEKSASLVKTVIKKLAS